MPARSTRRTAIAVATTLVCTLALTTGASASELIARKASAVKLTIDKNGTARVFYRAAGRLRSVQALGATNARHPSARRPQVAFRITYSSKKTRAPRNRCRAYDGPPLRWLVKACKAPDGSYWALQSWQRVLPNYGGAASPAHSAPELRLSHWRGAIARLEVYGDWVYGGRYHGLFGKLSYLGKPVHGFKTTSSGAPLDDYGRNLYLDTYNSAYGAGWRRENSFVARKPNGHFCYGFYSHGGDGRGRADSRSEVTGRGQRYRITVIGPGVTPDVVWEGPGLPDFDSANPAHVSLEQQFNALRVLIAPGDTSCRVD